MVCSDYHFKSAFSPSEKCDKVFEGITRTKQSFKDMCDINHILKRQRVSGIIDHVNQFKGEFGDFIDVVDYQSSLEQIKAAQALFDGLPARVRSKFNNDPASFLDFAGNLENQEEMIELGLATRKVEPKVEETKVS